jgi:hypothetical protein
MLEGAGQDDHSFTVSNERQAARHLQLVTIVHRAPTILTHENCVRCQPQDRITVSQHRMQVRVGERRFSAEKLFGRYIQI